MLLSFGLRTRGERFSVELLDYSKQNNPYIFLFIMPTYLRKGLHILGMLLCFCCDSNRCDVGLWKKWERSLIIQQKTLAFSYMTATIPVNVPRRLLSSWWVIDIGEYSLAPQQPHYLRLNPLLLAWLRWLFENKKNLLMLCLGATRHFYFQYLVSHSIYHTRLLIQQHPQKVYLIRNERSNGLHLLVL